MTTKSTLDTKERREAFFDKLNEDINRGARPALEAIEREQQRDNLEFHRRGYWHIPIR